MRSRIQNRARRAAKKLLHRSEIMRLGRIDENQAAPRTKQVSCFIISPPPPGECSSACVQNTKLSLSPLKKCNAPDTGAALQNNWRLVCIESLQKVEAAVGVESVMTHYATAAAITSSRSPREANRKRRAGTDFICLRAGLNVSVPTSRVPNLEMGKANLRALFMRRPARKSIRRRRRELHITSYIWLNGV